MTFKEYDVDELKHLQKVQTMMLNDVIKIFDEHDIKYYMFFGSAIGTVRHEGFIPWDDDVDICIFKEDYDKVVKIFESELDNNKYEFCNMDNTENYFFPFGKIFLNGTQFKGQLIEHKLLDSFKFNDGIFIDIFLLYDCPNNKFCRKFKNTVITVCYQILANYNINIENDFKFHTLRKLLHSFLQIFPISFKTWKNMYRKLLFGNDSETKYVSDYTCSCFYERNDFETAIKGTFEGLEVRLPKNNDKILTEIYGDYMQLPPEEERFNHVPDIIDFGEY